MDQKKYNTPPPSIFNAYTICQRQAWLMSRQMTADQQNTYIEIGRLIDDTSYEREKKKIYIADISAQIDMITQKDGEIFIAEIKKSSKKLDNALFQLKYYLYLLRRKSIHIRGMLKIPKEKKSIEVELTDDDIAKIEKIIVKINEITEKENPPKAEKLKVCAKCAHSEFCWA